MGQLCINVNFERVYEREDLYYWRTRGVYINLDGNPVNTARVGEGRLDARAAVSWRERDHRVIARDLGTNSAARRDAQIVESLLLEEYRWRMGGYHVATIRRGSPRSSVDASRGESAFV